MSIDRLARMRANPRADWTIADVQAVCDEHEVHCEPARGGGSHYKVFHRLMHDILTIPRRRAIKPVYIRRLVRFIDLVQEAGRDGKA